MLTGLRSENRWTGTWTRLRFKGKSLMIGTALGLGSLGGLGQIMFVKDKMILAI